MVAKQCDGQGCGGGGWRRRAQHRPKQRTAHVPLLNERFNADSDAEGMRVV